MGNSFHPGEVAQGNVVMAASLLHGVQRRLAGAEADAVVIHAPCTVAEGTSGRYDVLVCVQVNPIADQIAAEVEAIPVPYRYPVWQYKRGDRLKLRKLAVLNRPTPVGLGSLSPPLANPSLIPCLFRLVCEDGLPDGVVIGCRGVMASHVPTRDLPGSLECDDFVHLLPQLPAALRDNRV